MLQPELEEESVRLADLRTGSDPQGLHDLVSVQVRTDGRHLLLLREARDPLLEVVVRAPEPLGLAPVAGGAVGTGEDVEALELVAGVADVATDRRVGPLALAVAVEAQVQLDQLRHRV